LNLIKIEWQLAVAFNFLARDVGDDFFMRGAETKIMFMTIS
jgi:hypothetical protein